MIAFLTIWTYVSAEISGGKPTSGAALAILVVGAFAGSYVIGARASWVVPAAIAIAIGIFAVTFRSEIGVRAPLTGPLGYTNASAALFLQGAIGAAMVAVSGAARPVRLVGVVFAAGLAAATVLTGSQAATLLVLLPVAALLVRPGKGVRVLIVIFLGLFVMALASTVLIGIGRPDAESALGEVVDDALSARRPALWHDAIVLMVSHPFFGVGPGRFREESPVALSDPDASWAHNGFLQQGAEGGFPALSLTIGIFLWGFVRLFSVGGERVAGVGAASLAVLGIQACIDYMFHFPALPIVVALLVGTAIGAASLSRPVPIGTDA